MKKLLSVLLLLSVILSACAFPQAESNSASNSNGSEDPYLTYEQVQKMYPNKTVLRWLLPPSMGAYSLIPVKEVNEYLDSLDKNYAVVFETFDNTAGLCDPIIISDMVKQGAYFDIAFGMGNSIMKSYDLYAPISDYLEQTDIGRKLYDMMPREYWLACSFKDEIYGIGDPANVLSTAYCYYYNAELVDKYGYDINNSPLEQIDILNQISAQEAETGIYCCNSQMYYSVPYSGARNLEYPLYWDDELKEEMCVFDNYDYLNAVYTPAYLNQLGLTDYIDYGYYKDSFFVYASAVDAYAIVNNGEKTEISVDKSNKIECYVKIVGDSVRIKNLWFANGVASISEYKDQAFDLLATVYTDAYLNNLLSYGVKGVDYSLVEGKSDKSSWRTIYFSNSLINYPVFYEPANKAEIIQKAIEGAEYDEALTFQIDVSDFYADLFEYSDLMREFAEAAKENGNDFNTLVLRYRTTLLDDRMEEIIDQINLQYKGWAS